MLTTIQRRILKVTVKTNLTIMLCNNPLRYMKLWFITFAATIRNIMVTLFEHVIHLRSQPQTVYFNDRSTMLDLKL